MNAVPSRPAGPIDSTDPAPPPVIVRTKGLRSLGGGLRSWLAVRCTSTAALYLTAPPSCGCFALDRGHKAMREVSAQRPMERGGNFIERNGSERAQGRERSGAEAPREPVSFRGRKQTPREEAHGHDRDRPRHRMTREKR
jgi:hypothetical protein